MILSTCLVYFIYTPFDDWSYLRFLLPAIALMLVLASAVVTQMATYVVSGFSRTVIAGVVTVGLAVFCLKAADERLAFTLRHLEQRFRSAGLVVRDRLPASAVVLSVWDSGAVRFHGRKRGAYVGRTRSFVARSQPRVARRARPPSLHHAGIVGRAGFRERFGNHSDIGKLDWPPKYEIDRSVRIYDPKDRSRYDRGEHINTEYLWPLRD